MCEQADTNRHISEFYHRLNRQGEFEKCRQFIQLVIKEYPNDRELTWLVGYLVAGPDELRNSELAVSIAQVAYEKSNDEQNSQYLGWALFRAERWEECLDVLSAKIDQKEKGEIDIAQSAVIAMSLWQLGRKEEAVSWLDADYERRLADYIEKCREKVASKGGISFPTPAMLLMLDKEAKQLMLESKLPN